MSVGADRAVEAYLRLRVCDLLQVSVRKHQRHVLQLHLQRRDGLQTSEQWQQASQMTETASWTCTQCQKKVPEECNGKCGKGTTAERTKNK